MLTTEALVAEIQEKKEAPMGGGMDGMYVNPATSF